MSQYPRPGAGAAAFRAWLTVLEVGMADTGKLILFSSVYLFLPPFILIPSPGRFQLKIYSLLRCFFSLALWMLGLVWLWFLSGTDGKSSRTEELCLLLGVRAYVPAKIPYRCYLRVVLWTQPLFYRNSKTLCPCNWGLSSSIRTCASPWALMDLPCHATEPAWGLTSIIFPLQTWIRGLCESWSDLKVKDNSEWLSAGAEALGEV